MGINLSSLSGLLGPALTVGTQAAGAGLAGQQAGQEQNQANMLKMIALLRQKQDDALRQRLMEAQTGNYESEIDARLHPRPVNPPPPPQRLRPGDAVLQPDGTYKVPVPGEKKTTRTLKQNAAGQWVPVDETTGLDPNGKPVIGRVPRGPDEDAADRRAAQQTRLALGEARKDIPRPSKVPAMAPGTDAQGRVTLVPNPARAQATADSLSFEKKTLGPLRARFKRQTVGMDDEAPQGESDDTTQGTGHQETAAPASSGNPAHQAITLQAQSAISQIMASSLPHEEKLARVQAVNQRLAKAVSGSP